jgi:hypothetical protein
LGAGIDVESDGRAGVSVCCCQYQQIDEWLEVNPMARQEPNRCGFWRLKSGSQFGTRAKPDAIGPNLRWLIQSHVLLFAGQSLLLCS